MMTKVTDVYYASPGETSKWMIKFDETSEQKQWLQIIINQINECAVISLSWLQITMEECTYIIYA